MGNYISPKLNMKLWNTCCTGGPVLMYLALSFLDCHNKVAAEVILCVGMFLLSTSVAGFRKSAIFVAPNYTGTISSFVSMMGYVTGIMMSYTVGYLTQSGSLAGWRNALYSSAGVSLFGCVVFWIWGSGEEQHWNKDVVGMVENGTTSPSISATISESVAEPKPRRKQKKAVFSTIDADEAEDTKDLKVAFY